jgi:hypothetical protein
MTNEKEILEKFKEEIQIVRSNGKEREGYIINSGPLKAICITPMRSYGGGSRALWAIEGVEAQLTVNPVFPYIHGICLKIYDDELAFDFKPIKGKWFDNDDDWKRSSDNKEIRKLNIKDIRRYDRGHLY